MGNKNIIYIATAIIIIILLSGAFIYINSKTPNKASSPDIISVTDDEGYTTNLTAVPQRIVSLSTQPAPKSSSR